ncbi:MAG TPA: hypothetical protein VHV10_13470 [Ktedonobacteraceae bacterium]|nr:hypothetical protein [Ktedonobacteraceae bacterium]
MATTLLTNLHLQLVLLSSLPLERNSATQEEMLRTLQAVTSVTT